MENSVDKKEEMTKDVSHLVRYFEESEELTTEARQLAERDRDYYDNDQWTAEELATLSKRKQPALVINYIKRKVEFLRGFERRMRSDPKAYPRNPGDEDAANAATDALRYISDNNDFDRVRSEVYENMIIEGYGGVDVTVTQTEKGHVINTEYVPWDRLFYDPHSRMRDFSDAKYRGIVIWQDASDVLNQYPNAKDVVDATFNSYMPSDTYEDRPRDNWCDNNRKRIRVVQIHYYEDGEWMTAKYTKGGYLEEPQVSSYLDADGRSSCSLIMRSAYIDRNNNRYGSVRASIGLQDEINKRRSKALHLMNVRQTMYETGAIKDKEAARRELAKPDGMVEVTPDLKFDVLNTGDMASAQFQLLQQATAEMQGEGPNAALSGKDPRQQSGKAIQAQQEGGSIEMEPLIDELNQWTRDVYEACWARVRQFWTEEKWLRITDDDRNIKWVGLNHEVTLQEKLERLNEAKRAQAMQQLQLVPNDPRLQEVIEVENVAAELDVDIVIEEGPDISTLQSEQFEQLSQLAASGMTMRDGRPIPLELIIEASSLRNKDKLIKMARGEDEEEGEQSAEVQQLVARLQAAEQAMQEAEQEAQQLIAEKEAAEAKASNEADKNDIQREKNNNERFKLETERMALQRERVGELIKDPEYIQQNVAEVQALLSSLEEIIAKAQNTEPKVISIQSASGKTYTGVRDGDRVEIQTPSGEVYDGQIS